MCRFVSLQLADELAGLGHCEREDQSISLGEPQRLFDRRCRFGRVPEFVIRVRCQKMGLDEYEVVNNEQSPLQDVAKNC